jgi:hypothetical protein
MPAPTCIQLDLPIASGPDRQSNIGLIGLDECTWVACFSCGAVAAKGVTFPHIERSRPLSAFSAAFLMVDFVVVSTL